MKINRDVILGLIPEIDREIDTACRHIEEVARHNHHKVLTAFREARVSDYHLKGSTGYGYNDAGRDALEKIYATTFGAEAALVRGQIVSGTHAIALCLFGVLRPGDEVLSVQGPLYDTLSEMLGVKGNSPGSLKEYNINYRQLGLLPGGGIDFDGIKGAINPKTKMVMLQRSRGYSLNPPLGIDDISTIIDFIKAINKNIIIFVDNCYGEFVDTKEPVEVGADLMAGSLIKNPGGGLAPSGGYVAGKRPLVELAAQRWTAPGLGAEVGPSPDFIRLMFQGFFMAPRIVAEALQGAVFAARLFEVLGYKTFPAHQEKRSDIIQALILGSPKKLVAFCKGIQAMSPVDAHVTLEAVDMPGYSDRIIMAAGTFIQGASLELTCDAPMRPPYAAYLQGALSRYYSREAVINAALEMYGR